MSDIEHRYGQSTSRIDHRVTIVVLTHDRPAELGRCLSQLARLPEQPPIIVVDNGSPQGDRIAALVARYKPHTRLVRNDRNRGAAGRNDGVAHAATPYVAFCDDDCWWAPHALRRAADLLDAHPTLALVNARVLVGEHDDEDPACAAMAASPLDAAGLPGPALIAFMAGAAVMRTDAYRAAGGYQPRLFLGGEESLLALDLAARGWRLAYVPEVIIHHHPSARRSRRQRRIITLRNGLWTAWLRLPGGLACRHSTQLLHEAARDGLLGPVAVRTLLGLPWIARQRRVVPDAVAGQFERVFVPPAARTPLRQCA